MPDPRDLPVDPMPGLCGAAAPRRVRAEHVTPLDRSSDAGCDPARSGAPVACLLEMANHEIASP